MNNIVGVVDMNDFTTARKFRCRELDMIEVKGKNIKTRLPNLTNKYPCQKRFF